MQKLQDDFSWLLYAIPVIDYFVHNRMTMISLWNLFENYSNKGLKNKRSPLGDFYHDRPENSRLHTRVNLLFVLISGRASASQILLTKPPSVYPP